MQCTWDANKIYAVQSLWQYLACSNWSTTVIPSTVSLFTKLKRVSWDWYSFFSNNMQWLANVTDSCCSADCHKQQQQWLQHLTLSNSAQMTADAHDKCLPMITNIQEKLLMLDYSTELTIHHLSSFVCCIPHMQTKH